MRTNSTIPDIQFVPVTSKSANFSSYPLIPEHSFPTHSGHSLIRCSPSHSLHHTSIHGVLWKSHLMTSKYPSILNLMCSEGSLYTSLSSSKPSCYLQKIPNFLKLSHVERDHVSHIQKSSETSDTPQELFQTIIPMPVLKIPAPVSFIHLPPSLPGSQVYKDVTTSWWVYWLLLLSSPGSTK